MKSLMLALGLLLTLPALAADGAWVVTAEEWYRPRSGDRLLAMQPIAEAVQRWMEAPGTITVQYPGGEEGSLWARELRDWLVALGVPSRHIETLPGYSRSDAILIEIQKSMRSE